MHCSASAQRQSGKAKAQIRTQAKGGVDLAEYCLELGKIFLSITVTMILPVGVLALIIALVFRL